MRAIVLAAILVILVIAAFAFRLVDINQTRETKLPEVSVKGGQAPTFDLDTAKVNVGTRETSVEIPKVDVGTTRTEVKVPTVEVQKAN